MVVRLRQQPEDEEELLDGKVSRLPAPLADAAHLDQFDRVFDKFEQPVQLCLVEEPVDERLQVALGLEPGLSHTGSTGEEYATISLLPASRGQGQFLILQGLRQEGTEALGELLDDPSSRMDLKRALNIHGDPTKPAFFEALGRARAVAGAPISVSIVATRIIPFPNYSRGDSKQAQSGKLC